MIKIPQIEHYTTEEKHKAAEQLPAISRYLRLIQKSPTTPKDQLSIKRHTYWLQCALATLFKKKSPKEICLYWSQKSEEIVQEAWDITCQKLPEIPVDQLALFAFGKLGAYELNLSSDIDVLFISQKDPHLFEPFLKFFKSLLNDVSEFGFVFRVDLDLRPGGRMGPLIPTQNQFIDYYANYGETWERLALVRMRFLCGSKSLERDILKFNLKFCYRKYLDFSLLEKIQQLRSQIHSHYQNNCSQKIHLKTDPGGIRDIELFTHSLLVIHGGKSPQIRSVQTSQALNSLGANHLIEKSLANYLSTTYWNLRQLENLAQAENDQQTHYLTKELCQKFNISFDQVLLEMEKVSSLVETVTGSLPSQTFPTSSKEQEKWLEQLGFDKHTIQHHWRKLQDHSQRRKSSQAQKNFLKYFIEQTIDLNLNKNLAIANLADFIESTKSKDSLFSLFNHHPQLIRDLSYLFSLSPYLSQMICQRPDLLDSFLFRTHKEFSTDFELLLDELLERKLLTELVSGFHFLGNQNLDKLFSSLTNCADNIVIHLLEALKKEYGHSDVKILCLGKWGGKELGLKADLDFILITPQSPREIDHKIAKRLISRLTDSQRGGSIYDIDTRLNPNTHHNTLLISEKQLKTFLEESAEAWQRQAYLRARVLSGELSFSIQETILKKPLSSDDHQSLLSIRKQLVKENGTDHIQLKLCSGGLVSCEFYIQTTLLKKQWPAPSQDSASMLKVLSDKSELWGSQSIELINGYNFLRTAEQLHRLSTQQPSSVLRVKSQSFQYLARFFQLSPSEFHNKIHGVILRNQDILNALDPLKTKV